MNVVDKLMRAVLEGNEAAIEAVMLMLKEIKVVAVSDEAAKKIYEAYRSMNNE